MFDGESSQVSIGNQRTLDFGALTEIDENFPVSVRRENEYGLWQLNETATKLERCVHRSRRSEDLRVGDNS